MGDIPKLRKVMSKDVHSEKLKRVVHMLVNDDDDDDSTQNISFIGIKAMGGQGKTIVLSRVARNPDVLDHFSQGVVWINVGRKVESTTPLLSQIARAMKMKLSKEDEKDRDRAIADQLRGIKEGSKLLLLLDNVWGHSVAAVQELLDFCPENVRYVLTTREASVVEALESESINLSELSLEKAVNMLREQCGVKVVLEDQVAKELAELCVCHPLALDHVSTQLVLKCGKNKCVPRDVLKALRKKINMSQRFKSVGKRSVVACLAMSFESLEEEELRHLALSLSLFPPEKDIPLGALQRACGFQDRSATRMAVAELEERSIVSEMVVHGADQVVVVSVHGLMHEVLEMERKTKRSLEEEKRGESESDQVVASALQYFKAYHLVTSDGDHDALKRAMELYREELSDEEEIVLVAVKQNGAALKFCSERLRGEEKMVRAAMESLRNRRKFM